MPQPLKDLLTSKRFWLFVSAVVAAVGSYAAHEITYWQTVIAVVGAISALMVSLGMDSGNPPPTDKGDK